MKKNEKKSKVKKLTLRDLKKVRAGRSTSAECYVSPEAHLKNKGIVEN